MPITKKLRKHLNRTGLYKCDVCREDNILVQHHIQGRDIPDANHPSNLCNICDNCHRKIHEGKVVLEQWVMSTDGLTLLWHFEGTEGITNDSVVYLIGKTKRVTN